MTAKARSISNASEASTVAGDEQLKRVALSQEPAPVPSALMYGIFALIAAVAIASLVIFVHFDKISITAALASGAVPLLVAAIALSVLFGKSKMTLGKKILAIVLTLLISGAIVASGVLFGGFNHLKSVVDFTAAGGGAVYLSLAVIGSAILYCNRNTAQEINAEIKGNHADRKS